MFDVVETGLGCQEATTFLYLFVRFQKQLVDHLKQILGLNMFELSAQHPTGIEPSLRNQKSTN